MKKREKKRICCFLCLGLIFLATGCNTTQLFQEKVKTVVENKEAFRPITIQDAELDAKYYFAGLSSKEKESYKEILQGIKEDKTDIYVHHSDAGRVNEIFELVLNDFPEFFWCTGQAQTTSYENEGKEGYSVLHPVYEYKGDVKKQMQEEIEEEAKKCVEAYHPTNDSEYERIKYVYEYLIRTVDYETGVEDSQNIYSALIRKKSVCAGYAKATQYLLEKMGVFCTYVTGTSEGQAHAWNLVQCDGDFYYVDTTWGDPVFSETDSGIEISEEQKIQYDYLCCSDEELFRTHTLDDGIQMPSCNSLAANYYVKTGKYYEIYDAEKIKEQLFQDVEEENPVSVFKFSDKKSYEDAREEILEKEVKEAAAILAKRYDLASVRYSYQDDSRLYKITIYWQYG